MTEEKLNNENFENFLTDMLVATITVKFCQSNSVCFAKHGMAIGIGCGQQSRIHCTKLAGNKANSFWLKCHPKIQNLQFKNSIKKPIKENIKDLIVNSKQDEIFKDGVWQNFFLKKPENLSEQEKINWIKNQSNVCLASDGFFPFNDNVERAFESGVKFICQPGGSVRDSEIINCCNELKIAMSFLNFRLFHH